MIYAIIYSILLASGVMAVANGQEAVAQGIKDAVDSRGSYRYYRSRYSSADAVGGMFEGNCTAFTANYIAEAERQGLAGRPWVYNRGDDWHAVAVITDKHGTEWVLDNASPFVWGIEEYRWRQ